MSRQKPSGGWRYTQEGWVYTVCLCPRYPPDAAEGEHQVGHYTGFTLHLGARLEDHYSGGPHAARLLQVQKAAGGSFRLARVERGTRLRETQLKYDGFTSRCPICKAERAGVPYARLGFMYVLHRDPLELAGLAEHRVVYTDEPAILIDARITRRQAARLLRVKGDAAAGWRLVFLERTTGARAAQFARRLDRNPEECLKPCHPARSWDEAGGRPAVVSYALRAEEFPEPSPLAGRFSPSTAALLAGGPAEQVLRARPPARRPARRQR